MTERDPKAARESFDAFKDLVTRFPDSKYTPDAIARMNYLVNALASHEVHVARYYMKRGAYVAAANRAQFALKTYPQAPANEEGLVILVKAYDALGMNDLRDDAERVLMKNFPDSKYLKGTRAAPACRGGRSGTGRRSARSVAVEFPSSPGDRPADVQRAVLEVDGSPAQRVGLAATESRIRQHRYT